MIWLAAPDPKLDRRCYIVRDHNGQVRKQRKSAFSSTRTCCCVSPMTATILAPKAYLSHRSGSATKCKPGVEQISNVTISLQPSILVRGIHLPANAHGWATVYCRPMPLIVEANAKGGNAKCER
jgi:hypothetical protein